MGKHVVIGARHNTAKLYKRLLQREYYETMGYDPDKPFAGKR
jgi:hypothetical protein